jgi:apolipoprotein N-acyltransferase
MNEERIDYPIKDRFSYIWFVIGTLLSFFWAIPLVVWITPIFIIRFMRSQKAWRGFIMATLGSFIVFSFTLREFLPLPMPIYLVTIAITVLMASGFPLLADRLLVPRLPGFLGTLIFPLTVTSFDYIAAMMNPAGSLGAQAYSQAGNLVLMQLLSITGMWGITFLFNWLGPVFNWAWERSFAWPEIRRGLAVFAGILLLVMIYGGARLAYASGGTESVRMHGITAVEMRPMWGELNRIIAENGWQAMRKKTAELHEQYFAATLREAQAGADLVHWPEMAVMVAKVDEADFLARAQQIARDESIYLAMGVAILYEGDSSPWENKLVVVDPAGQTVLEHFKYGDQISEGFKPGDAILRPFETPFGTVSGVVCNDTNHQEVIAQAGRNGSDILLSPSMEFPGIVPMHANMAAYRAVENGVTVVRQADNGLSVVVDPYGRTLAAVNHFSTDERVTVAQVPANSGVFTLYPLVGDLFAWLAMAGFVILIVYAFLQRRREKRSQMASGDQAPQPVNV